METTRQQISLTDLKCYAYHGYYPEEQVLGTEFIVAIHVAFYKRRKTEDDLSRTVNYETLYAIAKTEMEQPRKLMEAVAESILYRIREAFPFVDHIEVNLCKSQPPFGTENAKATVKLTWNCSRATKCLVDN
ncbi:dihydroneopterin aldolase [Parapedobacter deserti]|uniref:7,8-dihydroneopterin aldolase n=1 Tax=Parapedobacter deserti TaxID=1912957 RepID=A0ABV7JHK1_9SPHI